MTIKQRMDKALEMAGQTKGAEISQGALKSTPVLFKKFFPGRKAVVITDQFVWTAAGEDVYNIMNAEGVECEKFVIPDKSFHAEWKYVEMIEEVMKQYDAIAIAVGSGVINDVCKLASHRLGQRYICIASAASADGYSASGSAIVKDGAKQTFTCPAPLVIIGDSNVLCNAPARLTTAGYADLAAKVPAGGEWMIADLFGTEPIRDDAWSVIHDMLPEVLADAQGIADRTPKAVENVFAGLTLSGVAMQIANDTRPLSCAEHLFSHYLDMTHHTFEDRMVLHGFQVSVGTVTMCAFFDELLKLDLSKLDVDACVAAWPTKEQEVARATELFAGFPVPELGPTEIARKWQSPEEVREQLNRVKATWPEFSQKLRNQVYSFEKMRDLFVTAGAPVAPEQIGVSRAQWKNMTNFVQLMRWRVNLFDLAKRTQTFDTLVGKVFGQGGAFEI